MTKQQQKRYDALLQRVTDIYSGAVGGKWDEDQFFVGAEEIAVIAPAISEILVPEKFTSSREAGPWIANLTTPEDCTEWLWRLFYRQEAE
jgi:hypothetical protein